MADILHEVHIDAPPEKVHQAITTSQGLRSWWTTDSVAEPRVGTIAEFGFFNRQTVFRMRIDELIPGRRIVWTCLGEPDEWKGTRLTWELIPKANGTKVRFGHRNWLSMRGAYARCNSTWGALMYRLKDYAEGRNPGPHFP